MWLIIFTKLKIIRISNNNAIKAVKAKTDTLRALVFISH